MNAHAQAQRAYAHAGAPTRTPRATEYEVIARITHRLRAAARKGPKNFPDLAAAIAENRRLWTALASDVASRGNGLPSELRAQIFYLAEFTEAHSRRVLRREAHVGPLLEVNLAILRGLSGQGGRT